MRKARLLFLVICVLVFGTVFCAGAYAQNITELRKQREEAQSAAASANVRLKETRAEKDTALAQIDALDDELSAVSEELAFLFEQLSLTQAELLKTEEELAAATQKREEQYELYKKRVRSQYINGTVGYLDVILNASDVMDLLNRVEYVSRIVESDNVLQERLIQTENLIAARRDDIALAKEEIEYLTDLSEIKKLELEDAKQRKVVLVESLIRDEASYRRQIEDLEADSARIEKLIKEAEAAQAAEAAAEAARRQAEQRAAAQARAAELNQGGAMMWPVPSNGYISSHYGNRNSPINGLPEFHTGLDVPAAHGTKVIAAEGGVVLSAGWNGGYGNTVIISHGNGISTLYAHNSRLLVSAGQEVTKGQAIAEVGSTGYSTGPHLHFEVRVNGAYVNPASYVTR